ncbi:MAG TPA: hypothetical protein VFV74_11310, partial [Burkholderiales bacterium]|nr:hypothetical protein [Burkholderiales bacterium]
GATRSSAAVRLELRPSPVLAGAIVAAHGAAGGAVFFLMEDVAGALLGVALLALGLAAARYRALLRGGEAVRALELAGDEVRIELGSGCVAQARVGRRRYVSRLFVALVVRTPLPRTLLVSADMLDPCGFRRLRIWALWGRLPGVAAGQLTA